MLTVRLYAERKGWTLDRIETRLTRDPGEGKISTIELELLLGTKVFLGLRVKVLKEWQRDPFALDRLGF